mgnify:CR=1 FL=1
MDIKRYFLPLIGAVFGMLLSANTALAFGPIMVELVRTIEIARVEIINAFGAERPISELQTWSGYHASFTYRKEDDHVVKIKIIPRERIAE